jgi:hypothetical protein
MAKRKKESILRPEGVKKLLAGGGKRLTDDERALLLALAGVDAELTQAVEHMVKAEPVAGKKMEWPELKDKRKRHRSAK